MSDKFVRNDDPVGARGAHGSRWTLESRRRRDAVETYPIDHPTDPGVRVSVTDYRSGTNTAAHACVCLDPAAAIEFGEEVIRQARAVAGAVGKTIESRIHVVPVGAKLGAVPAGWTVRGSVSGREIKPGDEIREDDGRLILTSPPGPTLTIALATGEGGQG